MGIFFNQENLILSLPLITLCTTYAFFKYVPLQYGVPALIGLGLLLKLRAKIISRRADRAQKDIDESLIRDLAEDEDRIKARDEAKASKKQQKANEKLRKRLSAERKTSSGGGGG
eukprot:CAMPEP_0183306856 /NCGR_PEP_ID=MMETSP0160_2-20130417/15024_1 /TAXON_ID=2839 ORGANISM="Odontella Sinensis, Strain Grunow 1884" /NCGR_SAMPLE_ID=MMETSP0160_2 /ASSEMBLY_ACC=CAM_ASM_000250 /LENGTH=114 /DNA_ID=CAMNT_0025470325 /DNA_START=142 /DNA_END=483 /DNA_ORIENTATION=-